MHLTLVTGGARSGKSDHAERLVRDAGGDRVTFIATAEPGDDEMAARIARHRDGRPSTWTTVEAPRDPAAAIARAEAPVVLLDCLTLLASNLLLAADGSMNDGAAAVRAQVDAMLRARAARDGRLIIVTNEVGLGIVPATSLGRIYRDVLGEANRRVAEAADSVLLMVSGIPVILR
jgi:adenosyl cobinamide kinase/adenosyl cobinamide phosphate guanylyltransferase